MKLDANFTFDSLDYSKENHTHMVVSLEGPKLDTNKKRSPIAIMLAIDTSSSMSFDKIGYAKKSALKLVDHLTDDDQVGIVSFNTGVSLVYPISKMNKENKNAIKSRISDLYTDGITNFSGGMLLSLQELNKADVSENTILRAIILTDGHANTGIAYDPDSLCSLLEKNLGKATFSAFGYGEDANQQLYLI